MAASSLPSRAPLGRDRRHAPTDGPGAPPPSLPPYDLLLPSPPPLPVPLPPAPPPRLRHSCAPPRASPLASPALRRVALLSWALGGAHGCSFLLANYNLTQRHAAARLAFANEVQRRRGPDATRFWSVASARLRHTWSAVHNLLSMTGAFTTQPFVAEGGTLVALFNGEVYNYRELAAELTGDAAAFRSDGYALLPAYRRWGVQFVRRLHGEFALVLLDLSRGVCLLSADVFGTKPLWWASWREARGGAARFLAATYESALARLGAPAAARRLARPNEAVVLSISPRGGGVAVKERLALRAWDLRQFKRSTDDWAAAFRRAVAMRTRGVKHRVFLGVSSGYDSGAIMLALLQQRTPFLAFAIRGREDLGVLHARARRCGGLANLSIIRLEKKEFDAQHAWLVQHCEEYRYTFDARRGELLTDDSAATGLSAIFARVRQMDGLVYLSGSGADDIISDYAIRGTPIYPHSCFHGIFPRNLSKPGFFPWCSFYMGSQRAFLMKEELTSGAHGIEGRYPFLDPDVVQEFLWLSARVKNMAYKKPIADFLLKSDFPNGWNTKLGFKAVEG